MITPKNRITMFLLVVSMLVSACTSTPTPTQTAPPSDTVTPVPATATITLTPTITGTATLLPTPTLANIPLLRTATPAAAAPVSKRGSFTDISKGIELKFPSNWITEEDEDGNSLLVAYPPGGGLYLYLYQFPNEDPATSYEETHRDINAMIVDELTNVKTRLSASLQIAGAEEAWETESSGNLDGTPLLIKVVTAYRQGTITLFQIYGLTSAYEAHRSEINAFLNGLTLTTPEPFGIPRHQMLVLSGSETTNLREYDPATTHGSGDKLVFSGLLSLDQNLKLQPELAASWDISPDGTVITFHLRENARFHNGRPVTAFDFIFSWERAADPDMKSDTVLTYLGDIVGVKEMHAGDAKHISGVVALDDHTLQVTIDAPKPYFLLKLTYPVTFVVDRANILKGEEWVRTPNGTGPYRLARWESFNYKLYERNPDFYLEAPRIPFILERLYAGYSFRLYEAGEIDLTGVSAYEVDRLLDPDEPMHDELISGVSLCTSYYVFDVTQPPFDDVRVRQAFSLAFDRQKFISVVLKGKALPAIGVFPPALPGYNPALQGLPYDPERARQLLKESKYGGVEGLPPIVFTDSGFGSDSSTDTAALIQMWEQNLGVTITVENIEPNKYLDMVYAGKHGQIFSIGWCADYPDPENFADILFHTDSEQNRGKYSNPEVDALLEQARVEQDVAKRIALYQQAEQLIVNDAPVLFTVHSLRYELVKPYIKGYRFTPINIGIERYLEIDHDH